MSMNTSVKAATKRDIDGLKKFLGVTSGDVVDLACDLFFADLRDSVKDPIEISLNRDSIEVKE